MHYLYFAIAIVAEVIATSALKQEDGFSKLVPSILVILGYGTSFYFLSLVLRTFPVGMTYAIWSGTGIVLVSLIGWVLYQQHLDMIAIIGMSFIVLGIMLMLVFSHSS